MTKPEYRAPSADDIFKRMLAMMPKHLADQMGPNMSAILVSVSGVLAEEYERIEEFLK